VLLDRQTTTSSAYGIYVMTPVEQITRYALIVVSIARQNGTIVPQRFCCDSGNCTMAVTVPLS
jgi:hypothetical protein